MAVEVKYVVIREGEEKMSFTSKKEADAWDKMLDTADLLDTWLEQSPVVLEDGQREALSLWLAEHKEVLSTILKTGKLPSPQAVEKDAVSKTKKASRLISHLRSRRFVPCFS
ncbi:DNA damage-inducible protein YebG [Salmonella enterica]|nr:DNA damage-inducible protein YebG [Salmonella enterica]